AESLRERTMMAKAVNSRSHQKISFGSFATICIVDSDPSVRESLEELVRSAGWTVAGFSSVRNFLLGPHSPGPTCLIADTSVSDLREFGPQDPIGRGIGGFPVILVATKSDVPTAVRAMKAGAVQFLTKPIENAVLLAAVDEAIEQSAAR